MKPEFDLKAHVRHVPDFPKPGILFYDISTLLINPEAWRETVDRLKVAIEPYKPHKLVGIESRGDRALHQRLSRGQLQVKVVHGFKCL